MSKTRQALGAELQATMFQSLDEEAFERLEETLIYADVGAPTTARIVERLEGEAAGGELTGGEDLTRRLRELLADTARLEGDTIPLNGKPDGDPHDRGERQRQDHHDRQDGLAPPEGAGPLGAARRRRHLPSRRRRAAHHLGGARRQRDRARRRRARIRAPWSTTPSTPPSRAGTTWSSWTRPGRLHTQQHLMDELRKIRKVIAGRVPGAPHETLLTIDATTGPERACARRSCSGTRWT